MIRRSKHVQLKKLKTLPKLLMENLKRTPKQMKLIWRLNNCMTEKVKKQLLKIQKQQLRIMKNLRILNLMSQASNLTLNP